MKFKTIEDLEIPNEAAFEMLSEFSFFERMAMRRGVEVSPRNPDKQEGLGAAWDIAAPWRGKTMKIQIDVVKYERPEAMTFQASTQAIEAELALDFVALSNHKTRLALVADISAKTLTGRLLVQSMKLRRSKLEARFAERISEQCRALEARYRQTYQTT